MSLFLKNISGALLNAQRVLKCCVHCIGNVGRRAQYVSKWSLLYELHAHIMDKFQTEGWHEARLHLRCGPRHKNSHKPKHCTKPE